MHAKNFSDRLNYLYLHMIIFLAKEILGGGGGGWGRKASSWKKKALKCLVSSPPHELGHYI